MMVKNSKGLFKLSALLWTAFSIITTTQSATGAASNQIFTTEITEVRSTSFNGQQVIALGIDSVKGPAGCKNSRVLVFSHENSIGHGNGIGKDTSHDFERIALRSLLNDETVVMSVQNDQHACVDGMPKLNDMWLVDYE